LNLFAVRAFVRAKLALVQNAMFVCGSMSPLSFGIQGRQERQILKGRKAPMANRGFFYFS